MQNSVRQNDAHAGPGQRASRTRCLVVALAVATGISGLPGCSVWQQARRTIWYEPLAYPWKFDRHRSLKAYRSWAEQAWQNERGACPGGPPSKHYQFGFKDGFVDFVYAGGDGQPPPVPPRKYWNLAWRSPQGHSAADEWFAGYRHGAKAARAGGYRNLGVVYSSLRSTGHPEMQESLPMGAPQAVSEDLGPPSELLPVPTPAMPGEPSAAVKGGDAQKADTPAIEPPAPALGPPTVEAGADVEADADAGPEADAEFPTEGASPLEVPPAPTPPAPANDEEAPPQDAAPGDNAKGAALMFRRAISAAKNNMPMDAPALPERPSASSNTEPEASSVQMSSATSGADPPQWPDPAIGVEDDLLPEIVPTSAVEDAADGSLAPRPNILRRPKN